MGNVGNHFELLFQVLQRKTEEAAVATKRLKELLEARKSVRDSSGTFLLDSKSFNCIIDLDFVLLFYYFYC